MHGHSSHLLVVCKEAAFYRRLQPSTTTSETRVWQLIPEFETSGRHEPASDGIGRITRPAHANRLTQITKYEEFR
jgi:hypothetical protein